MDNDVKNLVEIMPDVDFVSVSKAPIIKVLGVGGGGGNAARHMYNKGIVGVDFIICNTDRQALESNPIPIKIQLGETGLGAGANPQVARDAAIASEERIRAALEGIKMVFITAGMGGGTGTGASPIIASIAREMGILTVGIVTFPFDFEEKDKFQLANEGIDELGENVDALIVIKNQALTSFYPDLTVNNGFAKADDVLLIAAKSIAELITLDYIVNVDFNDVNTILKNSGTAIIGSGTAEGENRAKNAAEAAVTSPLLDTDSVYGAGKVLFFVSYSHQNELLMSELSEITEVLANKTCNMKEKLIWGHGYDDSLGDKIRVTVIATNLHGKLPIDNKRSKYNEEPIGQPSENFNKPQEATSPVEQNPEPAVSSSPPTTSERRYSNDELRNKSEKELDDYLLVPSYVRNKVMQENRNNLKNDISNYQAGINGKVDCMPSFLNNAVD